MISECCGMGKDVFIFDDDGVCGKKHKLFHQYLFENGYAQPLGSDARGESKILNEAKRIAKIVRDRVL